MEIGISVKQMVKAALAMSALETALDRDKPVLTADDEAAISVIGENLAAWLGVELYPIVETTGFEDDILKLEIRGNKVTEGVAPAAVRMTLEQAVTYMIMFIVTGSGKYSGMRERVVASFRQMFREQVPTRGRKWYF